MDEDVDQTVVSSTFPPPPPHHANFTARNLALLALLRERVRPTGEGTDSVALSKGKQREILADQDDLPDWDLVAELTPPRVDWIEESGGYESFGEYFFVSPQLPVGSWAPSHLPTSQAEYRASPSQVPAKRPTVEGFGVTRLMPDDPPGPSTRLARSPSLLNLRSPSYIILLVHFTDPKAHLQTLLHTLLHTYLIMLKALTRPPPSPLAFEPIAKPYVDRMAEVGVNMMAGVNALRETQVSDNHSHCKY